MIWSTKYTNSNTVNSSHDHVITTGIVMYSAKCTRNEQYIERQFRKQEWLTTGSNLRKIQTAAIAMPKSGARAEVMRLNDTQ